MPTYVANTFQAQTPIGQAMQNIAQALFQSRMIAADRAMKEREMAMRQSQWEAEQGIRQQQLDAQMPYYAAHARQADAAAGKDNADVARLQAMPDTVAAAFANLTRPQLGQVRRFQQKGNWGQAPTIDGLDNLGSGGDWMPTFANPETMGRVNQADMMTGMMAGPQQSDDIAKAIQQMMLNSQMASGDMAGLNEATAASKGKLYGDPNSEGLYTSQARNGGVMNLDVKTNPLVANEVNKGKAYSAHQYASAGQANAAADLNRANAKAVPAKTAAETKKADAYAKSQDEYQKGRVVDKLMSVATLVDTFFGVRKNKQTGEAIEGTPVNSQLYNAVLRDLEANKQPIEAGAVQQSLQRIAQSNPSLVSVSPETSWFGGDRTPQVRPQLRGGQAQPASQGKKPAAPKLPDVGEVRKGYRFKGGDPANKGSWEYVGGA